MEEKGQARGECKAGDEGGQKLPLRCAERHSRPFHKSFMISKSQCMRADAMSHEYPFILFLKAPLKFNPRNKTKAWDTVQLLSNSPSV